MKKPEEVLVGGEEETHAGRRRRGRPLAGGEEEGRGAYEAFLPEEMMG